MRAFVVATLLMLCALQAGAESVYVKYRGEVDLAPFKCSTVTRSSLIKRVCYDDHEAYVLIDVNGTYYHYCEIDSGTVSKLLSADSMGRYYNTAIKGNFDCRVKRMPKY
jgi:hypothetical protein